MIQRLGLVIQYRAKHCKKDIIIIVRDRRPTKCYFDRNSGFHLKNSSKAVLLESNLIRNDHVQCLAADHIALYHQLHLHLAVGQCGEYAVSSNGADGMIADLPGSALRQGNRAANVIDTGSGHGQAGANGQIVIIGVDIGMIKFVGCLGGGNRNQRSTDTTGIAVGGTVNNRQFVAALRLCHEGGRAAAVQVDGVDAAGFQHDLRNFHHGAACGEGLLTAVQNHHDNRAVSLDADGGTAGAAAVIGGHDFAVLDQNCAEAGDCFLDLLLIGSILFRGTDLSGAIFQDREKAVSINRMPFRAVHNQQTAGLASGHIKT